VKHRVPLTEDEERLTNEEINLGRLPNPFQVDIDLARFRTYLDKGKAVRNQLALHFMNQEALE
jgi:hypothetical protein